MKKKSNTFMVTFHNKEDKPLRKQFVAQTKTEIKDMAELFAMENNLKYINSTRVK